jgi:peptide/nickel transport system permease protein
MRITDIFLSVPPLILALAIASVLEPNLWNGMMAVSLMWWPWYTRLVYGLGVTLRNEYFVTSAEVTGASTAHILFREILPNTLSPILTKMSLDVAWVIIIGSMLSFVGLGVQPPEPSLGTMIADGARYLPDQWWIAVFPALVIVVVVLGFNLLGDGVRDMFASEEV